MSIPADTVSLEDYQRVFLQRTDPAIAAYLHGAAADGLTEQDNRAAYHRLRLMPRALQSLRGAQTGLTLFGQALSSPILIAPMAFHCLAHPDGERATATAAGLTGTVMTVSAQASQTLEEIAVVAQAPLWFQLYLQPRREDSLALVRRAEQAGYQALVLTIDAPVSGVRNAEQRAGFVLPAGITAVNLAGFPAPQIPRHRPGSPVFQGMLDSAPTWEDVVWLCQQTTLPVLIKGLLNPLDVDPALAAGAQGVIVSNHGGRTLDGLPATIDALPGIVQQVGGRVPVLVDGGIRRGTDIVKAIACGATAVMIGRPVLHALGVGGMVGVAHALTLLQTELEMAMALLGRPTLAEVDASVLWRRG